MNKKGNFGMLGGMATALVSVALLIAFGFVIIGQTRVQSASIEGYSLTQTNASQADFPQRFVSYNSTNQIADGLNDIPAWLPLLVLVLIGVVVLQYVRNFR